MKIGNAVSVNTVYNGTAQHNYVSVSLLMSGSNVIVVGTCYLCVLFFDVVIGQANSNYVEGDKTGILAMFILNIGSTSTVVVSKMKVISTIPRVGRIDSGNYIIGGNGLSFEKVNSSKNQAIIFKSDISLNFGSFSWYEMGTNITYNLLPLTPTYTAMSSSNGMNAVSKSSFPGFLNIGNPTASTFDIVNVTSFYPRPEGTYTTLDATSTTIYPWYSIAPTLLTAIPDKRYDISYTTPSDTITPQYSQWQNVPMLYDLYIDSSKSYPDWANFTSSIGSLLVSPAFAQASDMKDSNVTYVAIPNTGNLIETGFETTITLYNKLPVLYLNYTNTTIVAYHPASVDVLLKDPEGNSVFISFGLNNGLSFMNTAKYKVQFLGSNHWFLTFTPDNNDAGNFI